MSFDQVDEENDRFQLQSSNTDGVCITSISVNDVKVLVGKNNDKSIFWIDGNQNECNEEFMSSQQITIKNGEIISSRCKGF